MEKVMSKLSKTAVRTYRYAAEATGKIAKEFKLKSQMAENKSQIQEIYEDIGKQVYEKYLLKETLDIQTDFEEDCSMIDILANEVEDIRMELLNLKDLKQCPKCHYEIDLEYHYCPNCGKTQELSNEATQNDGPATLVTTDEQDVTLERKGHMENKVNQEKLADQEEIILPEQKLEESILLSDIEDDE